VSISINIPLSFWPTSRAEVLKALIDPAIERHLLDRCQLAPERRLELTFSGSLFVPFAWLVVPPLVIPESLLPRHRVRKVISVRAFSGDVLVRFEAGLMRPSYTWLDLTNVGCTRWPLVT
jgi:hypothetical protein